MKSLHRPHIHVHVAYYMVYTWLVCNNGSKSVLKMSRDVWMLLGVGLDPKYANFLKPRFVHKVYNLCILRLRSKNDRIIGRT